MLFKKGTPLYAFEVQRESGQDILYVNYLGAASVPNIAESPDIMAKTVDLLIENPTISRIIFVQQRNYCYDFPQVALLQEIAQLYVYLTKQEKILSPRKLSMLNQPVSRRYSRIGYILDLLKRDTIACYLEVKRILREERIAFDKLPLQYKADQMSFIRLLEKLLALIESLGIIKQAMPYLENHKIGDREVYIQFFRADIIPNFTFTRLVASLPEDAEIIDQYEIASGYDKSQVTILKKQNEIKYTYHIMPPEYTLNEDYHLLLNLARNVLIEHKPKSEEFTDPERTRQVFFNVSRDLLQELASNKKIRLSYSELNKLATILVRYTIGFGLIEVLLQDKKLQDIVLNSPVTLNPIFIRHQEFDECSTNIVSSQEDVDSWAAKFRMLSGRPLDEANPILDTDLILGNVRARVAVIQQPLSPTGLAYAFRRHREDPWTLPLFIENRMINSFSAGLLSFLIDGARTLLVAGTRSSGKCVDGNTLIQLSDGEIRKIKDLIGTEKEKIKDGIIYYPRSEIYGPSLEDMNINNHKITNVWKRDSPEKVIRVKTRSGKEIITTKEHPYFTYDFGMRNVRADMLKKGDLIVSPRKLYFSGKETDINLTCNPDLIGESEDFFFLKGKSNSQEIQFPKKINQEIAELIGMVIGDGHLDKCKLEFHNSCKELRERYISLLKIFNVRYRVFKSRNTFVVQTTSRVLNRLLNEVFEIPFGKKADKVVIPQIILKSDNNILSSFLRGYFDCDGYIPKDKRDIELVSASKIMSEHLRLALLRFGITIFTKPKKIKGVYYYRILIRGTFVDNFASNIGFFHPFKRKRLDSLSLRNFLDSSNVDTIPQGNEIIKKLRNRLRVSPNEARLSGKDYWAYETNQYRVTRNWFNKLIKFYKQRYVFLDSKREQIEALRNFIDFDYKNHLNKLEKVRKLLGLSYIGLAVELGISERGVRKILKNGQTGTFEMLKKMSFLIDKINERFEEVSSLKNIEININSLPIFVDKGIVSYAEVSRECNIPESTLKYCCQNNNSVVSQEKGFLIKSKLAELKDKLLCGLNEASSLFNEFCSNNFILNSINFGIMLSDFRSVLNISNEEFASRGISITSVANFFNGKYKPNFETLKAIVKTIIEIFDSSLNEEVYNLILESEKLADSDIFWDEIALVDLIDKVGDYVYDLTVEGTHNFVANGLIAHNSSMLGALMLEILSKYRIIVLEDVLELPVDTLRKLNYDILRMKVRAALLKTTTEVPADEGIRTSLRLGDSCLIIGEVRSVEVKALYEAMRVGALANVVAGTIHGASPYAVFDRVVNDLDVPVTSFKATDIVLVVNPVKSPDGLHSWKRAVQLAEVRKHWTKDPLEEKGFVDLLRYNVEKDELEPTDELINGDSDIIKDVASGVKGWAGNWDAVYDNILLRGKIKQEIVNAAKRLKLPILLEARFNALSNNLFHEISDKVREEIGLPLSERVFPLWQEWLKKEIKKM